MPSQNKEEKLSFFRRLSKDVAANTLAIAAASLVPVMAMIGGGVDASRYYMADSRMQAACDAGALAARQAMARTTYDDETHGKVGRSFFVNNFANGQFGVENLNYQYTGTTDGEVKGVATAKMPTTIMAAFGYDEFDLDVSCQADINISDTDIMMVLDITGSMRRAADGSCPGGGSNGECGNSRIQNLREAVESFYTTVDTNTSANAQVRYGFVPYAGHVNVSEFMQAQWMADTFEYSSREGRNTGIISDTQVSVDITRTGGAIAGSFNRLSGFANVETFVPSIDDCRDLFFNPPDGPPTNNNRYVRHNLDDLTVVSEGTTPTSTGFTRVTEYTGPVTFLLITANNGTYSSFSDRCNMYFNQDEYLAEATVVITDNVVTGFEWEYGRFERDVSNAFSGTVTTPTGWRFANEPHTWNGCVLHNTLDNEIDPGDFDPIPSGAHDINIDLVPTNNDEKWGPELPSLVRVRYPNDLYHNSDGSFRGYTGTYEDFVRTWQKESITSTEDKITRASSCPTVPAKKLAPIDNLTDVQNYLKASNGFKYGGTTIHNVGLLWGARLMSPDGLFASENAVAPGGNSISRHLVFMTDGEMTAQVDTPTAYGIHQIDYKVRPDSDTAISDARVSATAVARHDARLQAICAAVRNKNITLWVVAFGRDFTDGDGNSVVPENLANCATPGRAFAAKNKAELDARFAEIAQTIAALRLTQ
ncbi:pilus assembly protein TadG-related protein [uncultured Erythrobacter sp.]|uniref:pilus assembly protein TadG-related protein n=1 Tax=uncultured Erythrobacter sp. TaxID=263913 RepID=UPI00261D34C3|nr:pilus assembly protein TadG-related protein [uncultured Erythrobacter sp.]